MAILFSEVRPCTWLVVAACAFGTVGRLDAVQPAAPASPPAPQAQPTQSDAELNALAKRARARLDVLRKEADRLASKERGLLVDLRRLELARQMRDAELSAIEADLRRVSADRDAAQTRVDILAGIIDREKPAIAARLVRLYKHGSFDEPRWWVGVADIQAGARASRLLARLADDDRQRLAHFEATLEELRETRTRLDARVTEAEALRVRAAEARGAAAAAVAAQNALIADIDKRRDLAAKLAGELEGAQDALDRALTTLPGSGGASAVVLPIKPFEGALAWPVRGPVVSRFGKSTSSRFGTAVQHNGIEIKVPAGTAVQAIHEGRVAFADAFTGFGRIVIVDHGGGAFSLYGHLDAIDVQRGDRVKAGSVLGRTGRTPEGADAAYFELRVDGHPVDPLHWLERP